MTGLVPGAVYRIEGWVAAASNWNDPQLGAGGITVGGDGVVAEPSVGSLQYVYAAASGWQLGSVTFRAGPTGNATVNVFGYGGKGVQFQDLRLVKV